jgi:hypothetical protein
LHLWFYPTQYVFSIDHVLVGVRLHNKMIDDKAFHYVEFIDPIHPPN